MCIRDRSCADCAGVPNGEAVVDECGVCDGDNSSCADCAGVPNGDSVEDECGVCDGDGSSCECADLDQDEICDEVDDCVGEIDDCGICNGPGEVYDCGCFDLPQDACDCEGNIEDCAGNCNGEAVVDDCGICDGDGESCSGCTDPEALNFDDEAVIDNNDCVYPNNNYPDWNYTNNINDVDGCVLSNYNFYENSFSVTSTVLLDGNSLSLIHI